MDNNLLQVLKAKFLVLKCVRFNRLVPWISRHFSDTSIVVIVRHPCAVISSQMAHPLFPPIKRLNKEDFDLVEEFLPQARPYVEALRTEEELRAVVWFLDQYIPLLYLDVLPEQVHVETYETLVSNEASLPDLVKRLGLRKRQGWREHSNQSSREARNWSPDHVTMSADERIGGWKERLSNNQVSRILEVVERLGMFGVSADIHFDLEHVGLSESG